MMRWSRKDSSMCKWQNSVKRERFDMCFAFLRRRRLLRPCNQALPMTTTGLQYSLSQELSFRSFARLTCFCPAPLCPTTFHPFRSSCSEILQGYCTKVLVAVGQCSHQPLLSASPNPLCLPKRAALRSKRAPATPSSRRFSKNPSAFDFCAEQPLRHRGRSPIAACLPPWPAEPSPSPPLSRYLMPSCSWPTVYNIPDRQSDTRNPSKLEIENEMRNASRAKSQNGQGKQWLLASTGRACCGQTLNRSTYVQCFFRRGCCVACRGVLLFFALPGPPVPFGHPP
ncbi:uncharacterized protein BKA78DRAFT_72332 [Phyllosticta capitalensis]|uniref:uncharacterized protein n=1 Tax=Phyllosticta capitalensis TaxID=121624 RepID=UPI00312DACD1